MAGQASNNLNQPMPRMTDSMAHQAGPGPSSLKLAALSANSYHLDSPPFTGAAGPLGENVDDFSRLDASSSSSLRDGMQVDDGTSATSSDHTPAPSLRSRSIHGGGAQPRGSSQQQQQQQQQHPRKESHRQHSREGLKGNGNIEGDVAHGGGVRTDRDVPRWHLDDPRNHDEQLAEYRQGSGLNDGTFPPSSLSQSLSPPPFSSSGQGPISSSASSALVDNDNVSCDADHLLSSQGRAHRRRESSRPSFTQISHSNPTSTDDASNSSAAADGDADADESIHEGEVDGDDTVYVARGGVAGAGGVSSSNGAAKAVPTQSQTKEEYRFPRHRLPTRMKNESKIPLVIVACGSFSPPTYLHLRIFEMAKDQVMESGKYELLGGYYSPVSDYYKKEGLAKATHRVRMCELAVEKTSTWLMVDAWESLQDEYQRTAVVLDHFDEEINGGSQGGVLTSDGSRRKIRIMLLAGGDLIQSMGEPGVWADVDLNHILGKYGCMIVERTGADVWSFLLSHDLLWRYRRNLKVVKQTIFNDISSSKVRLFVRRGQSIKYLLPNSVIHYIERHQLYRLPKELDTEPPDADTEHM